VCGSPEQEFTSWDRNSVLERFITFWPLVKEVSRAITSISPCWAGFFLPENFFIDKLVKFIFSTCTLSLSTRTGQGENSVGASTINLC
jgi:hypothetical protein